MYKNLSIYPHTIKKTLIKGGLLFLCSLFLVGVGNVLSVQNTTVRLEIISSFTGSILPIPNSTLYTQGIYRTTGVNQLISLITSSDGTFTVSGNIQDIVTGSIIAGEEIFTPLQLSTGDGIKEVRTLFTNLTGDALFKVILFGIDTTPPPNTDYYAGPGPVINTTDPINFQWHATIDTGVGLHHYIIQLSHTANFSTAMEFTSTELEIILGAGSLTPGQRYRRRGAEDLLGNQFYAPGIAFTVTNTTTKGGSSSVSTQLTPIADQCPQGDNSGNYFDGICSPVIQQPILVNVPIEHQASDEQPWREKALDKIHESNQILYKFPNYDPPKSLTIYEYDPEYIYDDIYEAGTATSNLSNYYKPSLGTQNQSKNKILKTEPFGTSRFTGIKTSRAMNYLSYWFVSTTNSCADSGQFCPMDSVCWDVGSLCYTEVSMCTYRYTEISWCIWENAG